MTAWYSGESYQALAASTDSNSIITVWWPCHSPSSTSDAPLAIRGTPPYCNTVGTALAA